MHTRAISMQEVLGRRLSMPVVNLHAPRAARKAYARNSTLAVMGADEVAARFRSLAVHGSQCWALDIAAELSSGGGVSDCRCRARGRLPRASCTVLHRLDSSGADRLIVAETTHRPEWDAIMIVWSGAQTGAADGE